MLDGLIELPFALPTAVAGITLSKMYSETGILGKPLASIGIKVSYTHLGLITALVFVGIPFVVRAVMPVLEKMDFQYEEAAYMLGASPSKTFLSNPSRNQPGTSYRLRTCICKGNRRIWKRYIHIRQQCQGTYTGCILCNNAEA